MMGEVERKRKQKNEENCTNVVPNLVHKRNKEMNRRNEIEAESKKQKAKIVMHSREVNLCIIFIYNIYIIPERHVPVPAPHTCHPAIASKEHCS